MQALRRVLLGMVLAYAALCAFLFITQRSHIYHPSVEFPVMPERDHAGYIRVSTSDGLTLVGWYAPAAPGRKTILYYHGNAGHIGHRWKMVEPYVAAGYGVLLAGYRGFGGNEGRPGEQGLYKDARAYLDYLTGRRSVPVSDIVLFGESIGSGPAIQIAQENPDAAALILLTPFSSIADIARRHFFYVPVGLLLRDRFDNISKVGSLGMPQYYYAAQNDEIVPPDLTRALFEAASEPKFWHMFEKAGHNNINGPDLTHAVLDALSDLEEKR